MAPGPPLSFGALLPGADFFNHACGALSAFRCGAVPASVPAAEATPSGSGHTREEAAFVVTIPRNHLPPGELCINYGAKESAAFACFYGFLPAPRAATARLQYGSSSGASSAMLIKHAPPPEVLLAYAAATAPASREGGKSAPHAELARLLAAAASAAGKRRASAERLAGTESLDGRQCELAAGLHDASARVLEWHRSMACAVAAAAAAAAAAGSVLPSAPRSAGAEGDGLERSWFDEAAFYQAAASAGD